MPKKKKVVVVKESLRTKQLKTELEISKKEDALMIDIGSRVEEYFPTKEEKALVARYLRSLKKPR